MDQLDRYDRKGAAAQRAFTRVKVLEIIVAAAIPVVAGMSGPALLTAALDSTVVVLEACAAALPVADELGAVPLGRRSAQA
jgi:hypothetical protein